MSVINSKYKKKWGCLNPVFSIFKLMLSLQNHGCISAASRENLSSGFQTRSGTNQAVQLQKKARSLESRGIVLSM